MSNHKMVIASYPLDEISTLLAHPRRDRHVATSDSSLGHDVGIIEGSLANHKLICQNSQTPKIDLLVVVVVGSSGLDHLWGKVVESSAHGLPPVVRGMDTPSKVGNLELAVDANQDILRLDVSMDDMLSMEIPKSRCHLGNVVSGLPLWEPVLATKMLVQLALSGKLENQKDALAVMEVAIQLEDVGVPQIALNLNLSSNLLLHTTMLQLVLVKDLQSTNKTSGPLTCEVHASELSLSEWSTDLEHAKVELLRHTGLLDEGKRPLLLNHFFRSS